MEHDPNHMREATRRLAQAREERRGALAQRRSACYRQVPGLEELDKRIQQTVAVAIAAALRHGEDPTPAVEEARKQNLAYQARRLELLRAHGVEPGDLEYAPACALCSDTGWAGGAPCRCLLRLCGEENLKELSAQLDLKEAKFENFSLEWYSPAYDPDRGTSPRACMETVLEVCRDYAAQFPRHPFRNLYLYGGTGLGKTLLSGCMAAQVAGGGHWVVYEAAGAVFRQYEAVKFGRDAESARRNVRRYESCALLILDDLGSEMGGPYVQPAFYRLLNKRVNGGHTVISSNLDLDAVRARYGDQVGSRIEGEFRGLPFLGEDIRVEKKRRG